jgi:hypothetical protein
MNAHFFSVLTEKKPSGKAPVIDPGNEPLCLLGKVGVEATDRAYQVIYNSRGLECYKYKSLIYRQGSLPADAQAAAIQHRAASARKQTAANLSPGTATPGDTGASEAAARLSGSHKAVV